MNLAKRLSVFFVSFFTLLILSCSSIPPYSLAAEERWLANKPYPVSINFESVKDIEAVTLAYTVNASKERTIAMSPEGYSYKATIPGEEMLMGTVTFKIGVKVKGKVEYTPERVIRVLSNEGFKAELEAELFGRVSMLLPVEVPYFKGFDVVSKVSRATQETKLSLFARRSVDAEFTEFPITRSGSDVFSATIGAAGEDCKEVLVYASVSEPNADFGMISVFVPREGSKGPKRVRVLDTNSLLAKVRAEASSAIVVSAPKKISALYEANVGAQWRLDGKSVLASLLLDSPKLSLRYWTKNSAAKPIDLIMTRDKDGYSTTIMPQFWDSDALLYQLTASLSLDTLGTISVSVPSDGDAYKIPILNIGDTIEAIKGEIRDAARPSVPASIREIDSADLSLSFEFPADAWFTKKSGLGSITVDLVIGRLDSPVYTQAIPMRNTSGKFTARIDSSLFKAGINGYRFVIRAKTGTQAGDVEVAISGNSTTGFLPLNIVSLAQLIINASANLLSRIEFTEPGEVSGIEDLPIRLKVKDASKNTTAFLIQKKPGDRRLTMRPMTLEGQYFVEKITPADIKAGLTQYYFTVSEKNEDLGLIEVKLPKDGEFAPFELKLMDKVSVGKSLEDRIRASVSFTPPSSIDASKQSAIELKVLSAPPSATVIFYFDDASKKHPYKVIAKRNGDSFVADVPKELLKASSFSFFVEIVESVPEYGPVTLRLPAGMSNYTVNVTNPLKGDSN